MGYEKDHNPFAGLMGMMQLVSAKKRPDAASPWRHVKRTHDAGPNGGHFGGGWNPPGNIRHNIKQVLCHARLH